MTNELAALAILLARKEMENNQLRAELMRIRDELQKYQTADDGETVDFVDIPIEPLVND